MSGPDFVLCLECDTPVYEFLIREGDLKEAFCSACGNEELEHFARPEEVEELEESWSARRHGARSYYPRSKGGAPGSGS